VNGWGIAIVALAGCGRVGFTAGADADVTDTTLPFDSGIYLSDFTTCPSLLVLTGSAMCTGGVLEINADTGDVAGSAYFAEPIEITPSTSIYTRLVISFPDQSPNPPGDGMVIVVQNDPRGTAALGGGAGLGFGAITPSIGVELDTYKDTYDLDDNHMGIDIDGSLTSVDAAMLPFRMNGGTTFYAWVDIDGPDRRVRGYASTTPTKPLLPQVESTQDLGRLGPSAYVGVVGGTAFAVEAHHIHAWDLVILP
jgi:hypothetical protein